MLMIALDLVRLPDGLFGIDSRLAGNIQNGSGSRAWPKIPTRTGLVVEWRLKPPQKSPEEWHSSWLGNARHLRISRIPIRRLAMLWATCRPISPKAGGVQAQGTRVSGVEGTNPSELPTPTVASWSEPQAASRRVSPL